MENTEHHILEEPQVRLVPANLLKRFVNYFVDIISFSFVLTILLSILAPSFPWIQTLVYNLTKKPEAISLVNQLSFSFVYGLYTAVMEAVLKGKTIGKYITGTRAVTEKGFFIDSQTAFTRGLIRIIPLEFLSILLTVFLSTPLRAWHDLWSKSIVADESKSILPKNK